MKKTIITLIGLFVSINVFAENETEKELIALMGYKERVMSMSYYAADYIIQTCPDALKEDGSGSITREEIDELMNWEKLEGQLVDFYKTNYSQEELNEMVAFWKSDLGQKTMEAMIKSNSAVAEHMNVAGVLLTQEVERFINSR